MTVPVLIVDNSPNRRVNVRKSLAPIEQPTEQVLETGDGVEAREILSRGNVAIVFADPHIPHMSDFELIEALAPDPMIKKLPVDIVSSEAHTLHHEQLLPLGFRASHRTPFRPEQFRAVLRSLSQDNTEEEPQ